MATPSEVMKILSVLAAAYPNFRLQKATIDIYAKLLADIDADELAVAAEQSVAESEFFPTVAKIREHVLAAHKSSTAIPDWTLAWQDVIGKASAIGYEEGMRRRLDIFIHPANETAVRRVGWRDICYCETDQLNTLRAQFRDIYNAMIGRMDQEARELPATAQMIRSLAERFDMNKRLEAHKPEQGTQP